MKVVAVVHAKGKSERFPNKNIKMLGDKPLVAHAVINARKSKASVVYIDSDDSHILVAGMEEGALPLKRPVQLTGNQTTGDDLAHWQAQKLAEYDVIVQVVPTSPFTKPETIDKCIDFVLSEYNSSFTANKERFYTWSYQHKKEWNARWFMPDYLDEDGNIKNSYDLDKVFVEYTGVYAFKTEFAFTSKKRVDKHKYKTVPISAIEKIDINYPEDFEFAEVVWQGINSSSP